MPSRYERASAASGPVVAATTSSVSVAAAEGSGVPVGAAVGRGVARPVQAAPRSRAAARRSIRRISSR
jgi:hypothetical protein